MNGIYDPTSESVAKLVADSTKKSDATIVVPNLQRPFVWTPSQIVLLLDSMLKGWPFGTLLTWSVRLHSEQEFPNRPFWKIYDRDDESESVSHHHADSPKTVRMVLDGQQRLQSLVLAFGGDGSGVRMSESEWVTELEGKKKRGRKAKRNKTLGRLCLDLDEWVRVVRDSVPDVDALEYSAALSWVLWDAEDTELTDPEKSVLPYRNSEGGHRYLVLADLWEFCTETSAVFHGTANTKIDEWLEGVPIGPSSRNAYVEALRRFLFELRELSGVSVHFLSLREFEPPENSETERRKILSDMYLDSIVQIFTRLNTAGRSLTREDIIFAWVKSKWESAFAPNTCDASELFDLLLSDVEASGVLKSPSDIISAMAYAWAALDPRRDSKPLRRDELLKRSTIVPLVESVNRRWGVYARPMRALSAMWAGSRYELGDNVNSEFPFIVLYSLLVLVEGWLEGRGLSEREGRSFETGIEAMFDDAFLKFVFASDWSGEWSKASNATREEYLRRLSEFRDEISQLEDPEAVLQAVRRWVRDRAGALEPKVREHLSGLHMSRTRVSKYRPYLTVWSLMDVERAQLIERPFVPNARSRSKPKVAVDCIVSRGCLHKTYELQELTDSGTGEDLLQSIGNMLLLNTTIKVAKKSEQSGEAFAQLTENEQQEIFSAARISDELWWPQDYSVEDLRDAISFREQKLKEALLEWLRRDCVVGGPVSSHVVGTSPSELSAEDDLKSESAVSRFNAPHDSDSAVRVQPKALNSDDAYSLSDDLTNKVPYGLETPAFEVHGVKSWKQLYSRTLQELYKLEPDRFSQLSHQQFAVGKKGKRYIGATEAGLLRYITVGGLHFEVNWNVVVFAQLFSSMLKYFGVDESDVRLYLRFDRGPRSERRVK